jgi:UPF0755 protein
VVEQRRGMIPPQPRRPERRRPPRSVVLRRRAVALAVLIAALAIAWVAIASTRKSGAPKPTTTLAAPKPFKIVFPEGFTRKDMTERVAAVAKIAEKEKGVAPALSSRAYGRLVSSPRLVPPGFGKAPNLEGFLFPATYQFTDATTAAQLVRLQLKAFRKNWASVDLSYARSKHLTPYDVLTIASMVEKEAVAPEDRPKIARVIYNRLHFGMKLGIDATIRYGLDVPGTESLRVSQLNSENPYNTRKHAGLTPTPIASPGLASIQAAAHPVAADYLYFVRKPDKVHHFFTASSAEFENYKRAHGFG